MDYKKACEVLGVKEEASRNEIERRYAIILKRQKSAQSEDDEGIQKDDFNIEEATEAYNLLMGYDEPAAGEVAEKTNPILKKAGIDEKKARNFWDYYKFHVIGGIVLLIVVALTLKSCITAKHPDFNLAYMGNIFSSDSELLKANITKAVPEIKVPGIDGATLSPDNDAQQQYAMQMKTVILLSAADVDLFILDKSAFKTYAKEGAFIPLDTYLSELGLDKNSEELKPYRLTPKDEKNEGLYGIDISKSKLLKQSNVRGNEFVAAVPVRGKRPELAIKLIKALMAE